MISSVYIAVRSMGHSIKLYDIISIADIRSRAISNNEYLGDSSKNPDTNNWTIQRMGVTANIHRHIVGFARGKARNPDTRMPITWANCVSVPEATAIKRG